MKPAISKASSPSPTGSLGLDLALGIGGLPKGRVVEIYGPESSGKTTLALHAVAEAQKAGLVCAFIDAEHALDPIYSRKLGIKTEDLLISQPDCGEQALEITDTLVRSGSVNVIVIDSVAALTPRAELEGEMGDVLPGMQARLMSQALRKLTGSISRSNALVIFINQIRMKIGVMFGSPETTSGGNALKILLLREARYSTHRPPSKSAMKSLAIKPALKSSKTKSRRLSAWSSSILCMAKASPKWANCSISGCVRA